MSTRDIKAGGAYVEISARNTVGKELDAIHARLKAFGESASAIGKRLALAGVAIAGSLLAAAKGFAVWGDELTKASLRTGIAVERLAELKYAASQSGGSLEALESGVKKMQKALFEAANGSASAREALASVGLTVEELLSLKPDEQFVKIAERLNGIKDASARAAIAMELFGKGGVALLPLIAEGSDGIAALSKRARELGLVISTEDALAATKFGDILDDLTSQVKALVFQIGAAIGRALQPFAEGATRILGSVIPWVSANRALVLGVAGLGAALIVAGGALFGLGVTINATLFALSGVKVAFAGIFSAVSLLLNPVLLIGGGILALAGYLVYASGLGGEVADYLGIKFGELATTLGTTFRGIADALSAGEIGLAMNILWAGLKLAWSQGTSELQRSWEYFKSGVVKTFVDLSATLQNTYARTSAALQSAVAQTANFFVSQWRAAISEVTRAFDGLERRERERGKAQIDRAVASGKLGKDEGERLKRNVDTQADQVQAARDKADSEAAAARERELQAKLDRIAKEREQALDANEAERLEVGRAAESNAKAANGAAEMERLKLELELEALRRKASDKAGSAGRGSTSIFDPASIEEIEAINARRVQAAGASAIASQGVFNIAALQSLQGGGVQERIEKNTADAAKSLKKIEQHRGPTFR